MLTIRKEQIRIFERVRMTEFTQRMVDHLRRVYPEWTSALGDDGCRDFVRHGVSAAALYGIKIELDVARYLHVMYALGEDFDRSAEHAWAGAVLRREKLSVAQKLDRLGDGVKYHLEARRISDGR